jgi:hypothetical protein
MKFEQNIECRSTLQTKFIRTFRCPKLLVSQLLAKDNGPSPFLRSDLPPKQSLDPRPNLGTLGSRPNRIPSSIPIRSQLFPSHRRRSRHASLAPVMPGCLAWPGGAAGSRLGDGEGQVPPSQTGPGAGFAVAGPQVRWGPASFKALLGGGVGVGWSRSGGHGKRPYEGRRAAGWVAE